MQFEEMLIEGRGADFVEQELDRLDIRRVLEVADEHDTTPSHERRAATVLCFRCRAARHAKSGWPTKLPTSAASSGDTASTASAAA